MATEVTPGTCAECGRVLVHVVGERAGGVVCVACDHEFVSEIGPHLANLCRCPPCSQAREEHVLTFYAGPEPPCDHRAVDLRDEAKAGARAALSAAIAAGVASFVSWVRTRPLRRAIAARREARAARRRSAPPPP